MRTLFISVLMAALACGDSTGPKLSPLESSFVLEAVEGEPIPVQLPMKVDSFSFQVLGGTVQCLDSEEPQPWEILHFSFTGFNGKTSEAQVPFEIECEIESPNLIRYTYTHSGEVVVGEVWREEPGGSLYQAKPLPAYRTIELAAVAGGLLLPMESPLPDPMPVGIYQARR